MLLLLAQQQYAVFLLIIIALVISLSFHEYGHGRVAMMMGDDTAKRAGRLTLNPLRHIDPMGLLMVVLIGFGYAKPVPTDPRQFKSRLGILWVAAAGPAMNLLLAIVVINVYALGLRFGVEAFQNEGAFFFFTFLTQINLLLMLFNLLPIGPLDGHHILPYFLPRQLANRYREYNHRYGVMLLLGLVALNLLGLPVFESIWNLGQWMTQLIIFF